MRLRLKALRALRWNYKRRGVWIWLKGSQRCRLCGGKGRVPHGVTPGLIGLTSEGFSARQCPACGGIRKVRGYQRILSEPARVISEQEAIAEGVMG